MSTHVHFSEPSPGVALLLLDHPPKNFGTNELAAKILERIAEAETRGAAVAVLASDVPGYFLAHWSLAGLVDAYSRPPGGKPRARKPSVFDALEALPLVTMAVNNGQAWGGGAELSWACDLRIAGESATYGQPEVALGIIPGGGGTTRLAHLIGYAKCVELVLDCRPIGAREAQGLGAVHKVVPDARLREEALAWAAHVARWPRHALAAAKRSLVEGRELPLSAARRNEQQIFAEVARRPDALERMREVQARYDQGADSREAVGLPGRQT